MKRFVSDGNWLYLRKAEFYLVRLLECNVPLIMGSST